MIKKKIKAWMITNYYGEHTYRIVIAGENEVPNAQIVNIIEVFYTRKEAEIRRHWMQDWKKFQVVPCEILILNPPQK